MISEIEHRIRERAHKIWESEGRPADRAEAHWSMASAEIAAESPKAAPETAAAKTAAAKPRAPKAAAAPKAEKAPKAKALRPKAPKA